MSSGDFEMVPSTRGSGAAKPQKSPSRAPQSGSDALMGATAANMDRLIDLAHQVLSIQQIKATSAARVQEYEEQRKTIETEAKVYVEKLRADNELPMHKINKLTEMMQSFWQSSRSGEELTAELPQILDWLERL